jgi:hypothetical protein
VPLDGTVHRDGLRRGVLAAREGVGEVGDGAQGHAEAAPEGGVGGADRIADRAHPGRHRPATDGEAAQGVVQAAHHGDVGDRCEHVEPRPEERHRAQHLVEHRRVAGGAEAVVGDEGGDGELHGGVVTGPDAGGELVESGDDAGGRRAGELAAAHPVLAAVVRETARGDGHRARARADGGEPPLERGAAATREDDQLAGQRSVVGRHPSHAGRVAGVRAQPGDGNAVAQVDPGFGGGGAGEHPVQRRAAGHQRPEPVVPGARRPVLQRRRHLALQRRVLRPGSPEGVGDVGQALAQHLTERREQDVRLHDLRCARTVCAGGGGLEVDRRFQVVALHHGHVVPVAGQHHRRAQSGRAAADHDDPHGRAR